MTFKTFIFGSRVVYLKGNAILVAFSNKTSTPHLLVENASSIVSCCEEKHCNCNFLDWQIADVESNPTSWIELLNESNFCSICAKSRNYQELLNVLYHELL